MAGWQTAVLVGQHFLNSTCVLFGNYQRLLSPEGGLGGNRRAFAAGPAMVQYFFGRPTGDEDLELDLYDRVKKSVSFALIRRPCGAQGNPDSPML